MSISRHLSILLVSLLLPVTVQAQFMDYGSDPARFRWNSVRLPHYTLLYPQGSDSLAYRYALYLENAYPHIEKTVGKPMKARFPVILHTANMNSNGMVSWAPRRMELVTTPSIDLGVEAWDKHLVLHESRHIFQTGKVMSGIFKPLYYIIGEQAAGVAAFFLPVWYLEGDAVSTETALSNGGRGRLPEFNMAYRAQMMGSNRKFYSFDKWLLGSYKDYTGTYYALGYDMASYARQRYGGDIWDKTTSRYVRNLLFEGSFKHYTGSTSKQLCTDAFGYLKENYWKEETPLCSPSAYLSAEGKTYTNYRYPQPLNDSTVIALKSGLKDINSIVSITRGREERVAYIGPINSRLLLKEGCLYWTELSPSIRWVQESYSVLKRYDLLNHKLTTLTPRKRYLSPAISSDGQKVAVSCPQSAGKNRLVFLSLKEGKEIASFDVPQNGFIKELAFAGDEAVIATIVDDKGLAVSKLDTGTGKWDEWLRSASVNITAPVWHEGKLYFESGLNGTNNIYCLHPSNGFIYRITDARFGAFDPSFSSIDHRLFYADYQAGGYRIAALQADSLLMEKADFQTPAPAPFVASLTEQEGYNLDTAVLQPVSFEPKRYNKALHTFKIHSWAPFYYDVTEAMNTSGDDLSTLVKPGAMILAQNSLNTAIMQAGWYYRNGHHHGKLTFNYQGWFPKFNLSADYGSKAIDMAWTKNDQQQEVARGYYANRTLLEAEAQVYLPFNLSKNERIRGIQPSLTYYFTNNQYQQLVSRDFRHFQYLLPEINFYNYRRKAVRDILPRTGYQLRLQYLMSPFNTENYGSLYAARLTTYWPGILRNQGLMVRFGYQYQALEGKALYLPQRLLDKTRGYHYLYQTRQQYAVKADYAFSLCSPDWNLGSLVYIRRLRANLFYDLTRNQAYKQASWSTQSSCGADFIFDWNVFRMSYPLTTGVRLIQPLDYGKFQAEMLFSISF